MLHSRLRTQDVKVSTEDSGQRLQEEIPMEMNENEEPKRGKKGVTWEVAAGKMWGTWGGTGSLAGHMGSHGE